MKKKLTNNLWMKLLSLGIAIVFWFMIINSEDPIGSREFKDIPVKLLNESQVQEREKVLEVLDGDTVDVVVEGRRSLLDQLTEEDIEATADLLEVSFMDTVLVKAEVPDYPDVTVTNNGENVMKLLFDDYVTKRFSFQVKTIGEPPAGYYVGDSLPSPNIIQISGAKTVLDKVKEVVLEVDVNGRSVDFTTTAIPVVYDMNGDPISSSKLNIQAESAEVTVNVPILASKEIKVHVSTVGELPEGYELLQDNIAFQPETVRIAGSKEDLDKLGTFLSLKVDIAGQTGTIEKNIAFSSLLNDELESLRVIGTQHAAVKLTITPYTEHELEIPISQIEFKNVAPELCAEFTQATAVSVRLRCKAIRVPSLTVEYLDPYVDLAGCTEGTYQLPLQLVLPSKVLWDEEKMLEVTLTGQVQ